MNNMARKTASSKLRMKVMSLLKRENVVANGGMLVIDIQSTLGCPKDVLLDIIRNLHKEEYIVAIPDKKHGQWHMKYYVPPRRGISVDRRLEEIFTELAIPPWVDVAVFRGWKVIFVGHYGVRPGFTIIDYSEEPPLLFHDRHAMGAPSEIIHYKKRSKYRCEKRGRVVWYSYHGQRFS